MASHPHVKGHCRSWQARQACLHAALDSQPKPLAGQTLPDLGRDMLVLIDSGRIL
jgi:hypothetical protein